MSVKVAIAGVGVAGGVIATGLANLPGVEVIAFERVGADDHAIAGNGLNVGPNAMLALNRVLPNLAQRLRETSLPWQQWRASTVGGELLVHVPLSSVANVDGLRIRWAELYRACREHNAGMVRYHAEVTSVHSAQGDAPLSVSVRTAQGRSERVDGIDLLIAAEGRFSGLRTQLCGAPQVTYLGVANFRLLIQDEGKLEIDDLEQWFNGPCRLLAFRLQDGLVYLSGNIPIEANEDTPEKMKTASWLTQCYTPKNEQMTTVAQQLLTKACEAANRGELHWSRLQESTVCWQQAGSRVLFPGDAGHAMVPTLGQGATTAIEDGAIFVEMFRAALKTGIHIPTLLRDYEQRRADRVNFIRALSWAASDVITADRFSPEGVRAKGEAAYLEQLRRLYSND
jgi:salicylate hydroxylase